MQEEVKNKDQRFHLFKCETDHLSLPDQFTYPFCYDPHPIAVLAVEELKKHILSKQDWDHNFGVDTSKTNVPLGKMFGVLVVKDRFDNLGYLMAFSGTLNGDNPSDEFVPLIYDRNRDESHFTQEEKHLNQINSEVEERLSNPAFKEAKEKLICFEEQRTKELNALKDQIKEGKKRRKELRNEARIEMLPESYDELCESLNKESVKERFALRDRQRELQKEHDLLSEKVNAFEGKISKLKKERKQRSGKLQQYLFDQYQFLNNLGETQSLKPIFEKTVLKMPPAGAGDCAAPKLLQYAYKNEYFPIAMAEFWWGVSPKQEIRKHEHYYPSCKGKCEPILGHMLHGLDVEVNPLSKTPTPLSELEILYSDDHIAVINKPAEMLSVPGREIKFSVHSEMERMYPEASGPIVVHRLDMSTSGIMVITKSSAAYKHLQSQFVKRTIKKRYEALLEGTFQSKSGEINLPLVLDYVNRPMQKVDFKEGRPAQTVWETIKVEGERTRVYFYPVTGRTHQLRVHAAHEDGLNTPIVGDDIYGQKDTRLCLHAGYIEFRHPKGGKVMTFEVSADF